MARQAEGYRRPVQSTDDANIRLLIKGLNEVGVKDGELADVCGVDKSQFSREKSGERPFTPEARGAIKLFAAKHLHILDRLVRRGVRALGREFLEDLKFVRDANVLVCGGTSNPSFASVNDLAGQKIIRSAERCFRRMALHEKPDVRLPREYPAALLETGNVGLGPAGPSGKPLIIPTVTITLLDLAQLGVHGPVDVATKSERLLAHEAEAQATRLRAVAAKLVGIASALEGYAASRRRGIADIKDESGSSGLTQPRHYSAW